MPKDIVLTPLIVRQWYIGDGYLHKRCGYIQIATNGFTKEDIEFLCIKLNEVCNVEANIQKAVIGNTIIIPRRNVIRFLNYIGDCPVEIEHLYGYKWKYVPYIKKGREYAA